MKTILAIMALLLSASVVQAEPATITRATELRGTAAINGPVLGPLPVGATVELVSTAGGWARVQTSDGKEGFVRKLNIKPGIGGEVAKANKGEKPAAAIGGIATLGNVMRTGSSSAVVTTGVKGLSKEDIARATPNPAEVAQLEQYAVKPEEARAAANTARLVAQNLPLEGQQ